MTVRAIARALVLLAALPATLLSSTSCTTLTYVTQAAVGQEDLNRRARDIDELVREKHVDARKRALLSQIAPIKTFGEAHGLAPTRNYRKYVNVEQPAVVWVVSASEPLRFRSESWTFPLVGSFTYLGWFKRKDADTFADGLRKQGWDVDVRGAGAYSTAGFFEDAVLSTMISPHEDALGQLANTVLHEMTHATIFVKRQSTLNESIANFVGDELAGTYLEATLGEGSRERAAYLDTENASRARGLAMQSAFLSLEHLYASSKPDEEKLAEKHTIVTDLRARLHYRREINNATIIQFETYNSGQLELASLLRSCDRDWGRFVRTLKTLETAPFAKPQESDIGKVIAPLVCAPR